MGITVPTPNHPLPEDLQAHLTNARNLLTELEAEHARLSKFIALQKSDINANHEEKKSLEGSIQSLKIECEKVRAEVASQNALLSDVQGKLKDSNQELEISTKLKTETDARVESLSKEIEARKAAVMADEAQLATRKSDLSDREALHQQKVERLLGALK